MTRRFSTDRLLFLLPLLAGLGLLGVAAATTYSQLSFRAGAVATTARVVEMLPSTSRNRDGISTVYYPVYEFALPDGRVERVRGPVGSGTPCCEVGDLVRVLYDPAEPRRARRDSFEDSWLLPTVLGAFGAVLFGVGLLVLPSFRDAGPAPAPVPAAASDTARAATPRRNVTRLNGVALDGSEPVERSLPLTLLGIGLLLLLGAVALAWPQLAFRFGTATAQGRVVDMRVTSGGSAPVFTFTPQGGNEVRVVSRVVTDPPCCRVGQAVTVRYRPGDPRQARIASLQDDWLLPGFVAGFALLWLVPGLMALRARRRFLRRATAAPPAGASAPEGPAGAGIMVPLAGLRQVQTTAGPHWIVQGRWTGPHGVTRLFESEPLPFDPVPQMRDMTAVRVRFDPGQPDGPAAMDLAFLRVPGDDVAATRRG
jgi:hypothetical protein